MIPRSRQRRQELGWHELFLLDYFPDALSDAALLAEPILHVLHLKVGFELVDLLCDLNVFSLYSLHLMFPRDMMQTK